jgi:hemerythrin superfamily protein
VHAIKVLREDHARIEALFEELSEVGEDDRRTRDRLFERVEKELIVHTLAEENIFLPQVEDASRTVKRRQPSSSKRTPTYSRRLPN